MYLSDKHIKQALLDGDILIKDFNKERLQPASYDILLSNRFILTEAETTSFIDPVNKIYPKTREVIVPKGGCFTLHPGVSILGSSVDYFGSDKYLIQLSGKSSLARIGLIVHNTAGVINPGHFLNITFELCNLNQVPIVLHPGMPIAQLLFAEMSSPPEKDYKVVGRYHSNDWNSYLPPKKSPLSVSTKKRIKK